MRAAPAVLGQARSPVVPVLDAPVRAESIAGGHGFFDFGRAALGNLDWRSSTRFQTDTLLAQVQLLVNEVRASLERGIA